MLRTMLQEQLKAQVSNESSRTWLVRFGSINQSEVGTIVIDSGPRPYLHSVVQLVKENNMANLASSPVREANDECYMRKLETIRDIR